MTFAEKLGLDFRVVESTERLKAEGRPHLVMGEIAESIIKKHCAALDAEWREQCLGR